MVVLAIFACIFLAIVMIKIVKAMMSMIDHLDAVAEGNLESRISDRMTSRSDEIGNIARALYFTHWRTGHDCKKHPDIRKVAG